MQPRSTPGVLNTGMSTSGDSVLTCSAHILTSTLRCVRTVRACVGVPQAHCHTHTQCLSGTQLHLVAISYTHRCLQHCNQLCIAACILASPLQLPASVSSAVALRAAQRVEAAANALAVQARPHMSTKHAACAALVLTAVLGGMVPVRAVMHVRHVQHVNFALQSEVLAH
jgi:hypothetical protein